MEPPAAASNTAGQQYQDDLANSLFFPAGFDQDLDPAAILGELGDLDDDKLAELAAQPDLQLSLDQALSGWPGIDIPQQPQYGSQLGYAGQQQQFQQQQQQLHQQQLQLHNQQQQQLQQQQLYQQTGSIPFGISTSSTNQTGPLSSTSTCSSVNESFLPSLERSPATDPEAHDALDSHDAHDTAAGTLDGLDNTALDSSELNVGDGFEKDRPGPKKPGRKPLTSEPTTKRKAQNRAAQRAFRERKEKHLKDLETRVETLQKTSVATNQENGRLRAQVERLQVELRECRKRLSLNSSIVPITNHTPPLSRFPNFNNDPTRRVAHPLERLASLNSRNLPATNKLLLDRLAKNAELPVVPPELSLSPRAENGSPLSGSAKKNGLISAEDPNRNFLFSKNQSSPLPSYMAAVGLPISSPALSHDTPVMGNTAVPDKLVDALELAIANPYASCEKIDGETSFCELLNMACGNKRNPIPKLMASSSRHPSISSPSGVGFHKKGSMSADISGISLSGVDPLLSSPHLDSLVYQPTPVLDGSGSTEVGQTPPQPPVVPVDASFAPFSFDAAARSPPTRTEPATREEAILVKSEGGDDEDDDDVVPGEDTSTLLNCHTIWSKLKESKVETQNINIDELCTELRAKARCSENGVVIDKRDVDETLRKLPEFTKK